MEPQPQYPQPVQNLVAHQLPPPQQDYLYTKPNPIQSQPTEGYNSSDFAGQ